MRRSAFGEVYKAVDEMSSDYVAMKRMKNAVNTVQLQAESSLLKECNSKYIVRYYSAISKGNEYWVWFCVVVDGIDCNGVLPLWISCCFHWEWKSVE